MKKQQGLYSTLSFKNPAISNPRIFIDNCEPEHIERKLAAPFCGSFEASSTTIASTTASPNAIHAI